MTIRNGNQPALCRFKHCPPIVAINKGALSKILAMLEISSSQDLGVNTSINSADTAKIAREVL